MTKLRDIDKIFVERYLVHFNAHRAARESGLEVKKPLNVLSRPHIKEAIQEGVRKVCERNQVNQDDTISDLIRMASTDMDDFVQVIKTTDEETGYVDEKLVLRDWDRIDTSMIKKIKQTRDGIQLELYDRQRARETLARYHGLLIDNVKLDGVIEVKGFVDLVKDIENENTIEENKDLFE